MKGKQGDTKTVVGKIVTLTRERDKLKEEFIKSKADVEISFKDLNDAKRKAYSSFNIQSENLDQRVVDNLGVFKKKLFELSSNLKLTSIKSKRPLPTTDLSLEQGDSDLPKVSSKPTRLVTESLT